MAGTGRGKGRGLSWQMFANAKHARISCIFTNFDIYKQPLALPIDKRCQGQKGEAGQGGNKLKSSLNSFICLWKTLPSSHTHTHTHAAAIRHTGHSQDTHLNDLWRKWRQVCRLSLSLSYSRRSCLLSAMWSKRSQLGQVKVVAGKGAGAAWELVQYLGALEQFVT